MTRPVEVAKVLSANDVGKTGTHQAGILVPKVGPYVPFFPSLKVEEANPDCRVTLVAASLGVVFRARFVYYNSRRLGLGTRDEYRLTGLTKLLRSLGAAEGDALHFRRVRDDEFEVRLVSQPRNDRQDKSQVGSAWRIVAED